MSERLFVATRKGLFIFEQARAGWRVAATAFLGEPVTAVLPDAVENALYVALNLGHFGVKLHRSRDAGASWEEIAAPRYPTQPPDAGGPPWSLVQVWSLEAGGAQHSRVLWAGTIPGGLFRSRDAGETWTLVHSLWERPERLEWFGGGNDYPGIHSICLDPRDDNRITVAVSCGGVWHSDDGGETWTLLGRGMRAAYMPPGRADDPAVQDPHRMVLCKGQPDTCWVQHHNGIFRSTDGARTWREIEGVEPSAFGFAVAVHPRDPDLAWLVPLQKDECRVPVGGAVVVNRTRDGGASFATLRAGLPQHHAYDVVYRHALDVDATGEILAFGSTTGSLWASLDQGDHWQALSHHLPPVYCVRFG